eukprot:Gb_04207 [translate_table: standard]
MNFKHKESLSKRSVSVRLLGKSSWTKTTPMEIEKVVELKKRKTLKDDLGFIATSFVILRGSHTLIIRVKAKKAVSTAATVTISAVGDAISNISGQHNFRSAFS